MTPLALELEGFTCYRERTRVEWDAAETALFAVTGPTGAGKSTLLDAITYVLYGKTARLGGRGLSSLISPGLDALFVQLTFRTARGVFRVTRAAQRRTAGVGTEVRIEISDQSEAGGWRQLTDSERVKDANDALTEIVGLDYDGFTRAVLLPQGAFDEFLRGDARLRRQLLSSLLGLDRVEEIQKLASARAGQLKADGDARRSLLAAEYADVTAGAVKELKELVAALAAAAEEESAEVEARERELATVKRTAELQGERAELGRRREQLRQRSAAVQAARHAAARGRRAAVLAPQIEQLRVAERRAAETREQAEAKAAQLAAAQEALARTSEEAERQGQLAAERTTAVDEELEALAAAAPALGALTQRGGSLALAAGALRAQLLDEEAWSGWRTALSLAAPFGRAVKEQHRARRELEGARRALAELEARVGALARAQAERLEEGQRLRAAEQAARQSLDEARRADMAAAVRQGLAPGDPCPVCGAPIGEHAPAEEHGDGRLAAAEAEAERAGAAVAQAVEEFNERKAELSGAEAQKESAAKLVAAADEARGAADAAAREAAADLASHGAAASAQADGAYPAAAEGEVRRELEARLAAALAAHARAVAEQLTRAGVTPSGELRVDERVAELKRELAAVAARLQAAERERQQASNAVESAGTQLAATRANAELFAADAAQAQAALERAVAAAGFADADEAVAARLDDARLEQLENEVASHDQELERLDRRDVELAAELAARPPLPNLPPPPAKAVSPFGGAQAAGEAAGRPATASGTDSRAVTASGASVRPATAGGASAAGASAGELAAYLARLQEERRAALRRKQEELGGARHQLLALEGQLERSVALRRELKALDEQHALYHQLNTDLHGHRFPEHLLTQVQQLLARRASSILQHVTDGRYDLRLADGDYLVADAWAGGELRSARTLSGGESFVASLALALALSDTLAGNAALGALFLDEGFGTLDRETLEAVTGVLESLTDEGRMVGVITHVPELSERLPARLVVTKGPSGSTVAWDA